MSVGIVAFGAAVTGVAPAADVVPAHVQTWYYYGLNHVNEHVPPEIMARYADFAEGGDDGEFAARFKAAGGRYTAAYDDPAYVPYCDPPFAPPAGRCKSEYSRFVAAESGWFHGPDGTRVRHYVPGDRAYQEAINPGSPAATCRPPARISTISTRPASRFKATPSSAMRGSRIWVNRRCR